MKRRNFLQTGALGVVGLSLNERFSALTQEEQPGVQNWLNQFSEAVRARRRSLTFFCPQQLAVQVNQTNAFMAIRGYMCESTGAYFCAEGQICFYPLQMRQKQAQLNDVLIPVFHRQNDGNWKRLVVLTGYQLEAMQRAATALAAMNLPINELLLPAGCIPSDGSKFTTSRGEVSIKTRIDNGFAHTEISIREDQKTLFSDSFRSQHTLRSTLSGTT